MTSTHDSNEHVMHMPSDRFYEERPIDFFSNNPDEYHARLRRARSRVLEAVGFAVRPLRGYGLNHELRAIGTCLQDLANFVDQHDRTHGRKFRKQHPLFLPSDIPTGYFGRITKSELDQFVGLMNRCLIEAAIMDMFTRHELVLVNHDWHVKVSVMDAYRSAKCRKPHSRVKRDDRSFHGRPRRDRHRQLSVSS
jgi:hypothetical protein